MNLGKINEVSILVDSLIGFYTLEPILNELILRGVRMHVYCREKVIGRIAESCPEISDNLYSLDLVIEGERWLFYLHRFLRQILTRPDFSFQYRLLSDPRQYPGDWRYWITAQLAKLSPGLPHNRVNRALARAVQPLIRNHFLTTRLLTVSRTSLPHLLCNKDVEVITVMESWDHPVKWPVGHRSKAVFTWNEDLATDWREYQGDEDVYASYPLKLRYWLERDFPVRPMGERRIAIYAAGTSSMSYINGIHQYELKVIEAVAESTLRAGWRLLIKPKPNGKTGDFDCFSARYPHVDLGAYSNVDTPVDYYLDDDCNRQREAELTKGDLLINALTTFVLDAALGGLACLQLDLRYCPEYKGASEGQANYHLARYLLDDSALCLVAEPGRLVEQLTAYLKTPDNRAELQRDRLRSWLQPKHSLTEAVNNIVDHLLDVKISK